jgi:hypothetical protein
LEESSDIFFHDGFTVMGEKLPDGGFTIYFDYESKCLPDTVDPQK